MLDNVKHIIDSELQEGEELLWSHVISHENSVIEKKLNSKVIHRLSKWFNRILMLVFAIMVIRFVLATPSLELMSLLKGQLPVLVFAFLLMLLIDRTKLIDRLEKTANHLLYGSCIITDKRILLFNHNSSDRQEFKLEDVAQVSLDYENGGRALRVKALANDKDSLLIGIADFKSALAILAPFGIAR